MLSPQAALKPSPFGTPTALPSAVARHSDGPDFAQLLQVQTPPAPQPAPAPQRAAAPAWRDPAPQAAPADAPKPAKAPAPAPAANAKPAAANPAKPPAPTPAKGTADAPRAAQSTDATDAGSAADGTDPTDPQGLDQFGALAGLTATANGLVNPALVDAAAAAQAARENRARTAPADAAADGADAATTDRADAARGGRHRSDAGHLTKPGTEAAGAADLAGQRGAGAGHAAAEMFGRALATQEARTAITPLAAGADAALPSFAASLQAASGQPLSANGPATTGSAEVAAPLHSPAFGPELATRVSLMTVDGVQHAELQLNPADMGPVAVQIVLDGSQAQVSFHAAQAATRQALEHCLPDLAAALQGQGLTLSGGGVFQQAPRQQPGSGEADAASGNSLTGGRPAGAARGAGTSIETLTPRRTVGLLDTFA